MIQKVTVGGIEAAYRESGSGEPVLYLHGFPTSSYLWRDVMQQVGRGYRAIAPDLPSFGESALLDGPHTWESMIEWTDAFVETLKLAPVHLAVHDWGGLIGLAWASLNPEKVSSLLITDTSFRSTDHWHAMAREWRKEGVGEELIGEMNEAGFRAFVSMVTPVEDHALAEYWKGLSTTKRRAAKLELYRSLEFEMLAPLEPKLPKVAPGRVLVVWGEPDPVLSTKLALRFGEKLGADVKIIEGAGHFLQEQAGGRVGYLHKEFLDSLQ